MVHLNEKTNVLVLAPHTDDGELGCGGTIARLIEEGHQVYYAAFSTCEKSVPAHLPPDILKTEVKKATIRLGIQPENLIIFDYEVRKLNYSRQDILEDMVKLKRDLNPDLILMPSTKDIHQDHSTVAVEGLRAFKELSILSYELPWNSIEFNTNSFVKLKKDHVMRKIDAMKAYESQSHRKYCSQEFLQGWATMRGTQIGTDFAEAFEVVRWVM